MLYEKPACTGSENSLYECPGYKDIKYGATICGKHLKLKREYNLAMSSMAPKIIIELYYFYCKKAQISESYIHTLYLQGNILQIHSNYK